MTAQPIAGLQSEPIPTCYVLASQRFGKQCYPNMQSSENASYKKLTKAQKDKEGEGRGFSGSLAKSYQ